MKNEEYIEELKVLKNSTALWNNPEAVEAIEAGIEALEEKDAEETSCQFCKKAIKADFNFCPLCGWKQRKDQKNDT